MAFIEDVRINGQQSSSTATPTIAGLNPVITWDFVDDPAAPSQQSFELRIGLTNTSWGFDAFVGDIVNVNLDNTANVYEHENHDLERGTTYFGQVRVTDSDSPANTTVWAQFSYVVNQLPFVTNFLLSPANPDSSDNIDLTYTFFDPDSHGESGTKIRWFKDSFPIIRYDDLCTLPASATDPSESWTVKIIPSDGLEFGAVVETAAVTIVQTEVGVSNVKILPVDANVDDLLKVEFNIDDTEYISVTGIVVIEWFVNGVAISNSNQTIIRLVLDPGDIVQVAVRLTDGQIILVEMLSNEIVIADVEWHIFNVRVNGLTVADDIADLTPFLDWDIHKTTAGLNDKPSFLRVLVTKTLSLSSPIFDSGSIAYTKNSFTIPSSILKRGQRYFIHIAASDSSTIDNDLFTTTKIQMSGSSWALNVSNTTGWTIEFKLSVDSGEGDEPNMGVYIHDGSFFCSITLALRKITFLSDNTVTFAIPTTEPDLSISRTFKIAARGQDLKIFMDNNLIINTVGGLTNASNLKFIEYGDIDTKNNNTGTFKFFRYSTNGAFGFGDSLPDENTFLFAPVGLISGGSIDFVLNNLISWLPDDTDESTKLIKFNENSDTIRLPTVTKNFSPVTAIFIDEKRNKYIGTANGITAIFGEKHDPDFELDTSATDVQITPDLFDRISNVPSDKLSLVEPDIKQNWFTIDTTYRTLGVLDPSTQIPVDDEYDPYINPIISRAVHYYSQRTHGHAWFDKADNTKGWQAAFSFQLDKLEADDFLDTSRDKHGFGVYVNDGTRQEILYFYEDRIRLFYANVFVPVITTIPRNYAIVGKGDDLKVYQKLDSAPAGTFQLLIDGSGLFTTPSTKTGNSRKPRVILDGSGIYHAVWHDDSNGRSQIFYSEFDGNNWSIPQLVTLNTQFSMSNPDLDIDSQNRVWVVYEDTSWGLTEISVSVKDSIGWNPKTRITNFKSDKGKPSIKVDANDNVHLVWEDNRNGNWEILWVEWQTAKQAWISSAQFGEDTVIAQSDDADPYQAGAPVEFRNPHLALLDPLLWVTYESRLIDSNESIIQAGFRNTVTGVWNSSATPSLAGGLLVIGSSIGISLPGHYSVNPDISVNATLNLIVITWEDQTEPISQIWGATLSSTGSFINDATRITSGTADSNNPSVGFVGSHAVIIFERNNVLFLVFYNSSSLVFVGSATSGSDRQLTLDSTKTATFPSVPPNTPTSTFRFVYDFREDRDPYTISTLEFPDFQLIGDAVVVHSIASTSTDSNGVVSNIDTKEFAFGDLSDNVGMVAHWRRIELYFGYDAVPASIAKFNQRTVNGFPDDRICDLFVDTFGNIIAATFRGLIYHNVFTGQLTVIEGHTDSTGTTKLLLDKLVTSVKWGGNGIWYVGTTEGAFFSRTAGKIWEKLAPDDLEDKVINAITVSRTGEAIVSTSTDGIFIAHPDQSTVHIEIPGHTNIRAASVDENDIIWAGSDLGLIRIENFSQFIFFNRNQGMRSSHVNDIAIVNKHLRYVATASGVERMNGMQFVNFNVRTHAILNDNIARLTWDERTNSLWVASLSSLHEIVFRDPVHDIIDDEVTQYSFFDISTEEIFDKDVYFLLDFDIANPNSVRLSSDSASVFLNKNKLTFGFIVDESSILFSTDLLVNDQVEVEISDKFLEFHDFNQTDIEKSVRGNQRTSIPKMDITSKGQLLLLSNLDKPRILLFSNQSADLPFTTILLDRDLPIGCLEKLSTLTRTRIRFRILAFDQFSGLDSFMLSNFENFTSDGETPLSFQPIKDIVEHDIGAGINNVIDSLSFPSTVVISGQTETVGTGSALGKWFDTVNNIEYLYAGTSGPAVIFRLDPTDSKWTALQTIDKPDSNRTINEMKEINNVLFITTGTDTIGGNGAVYRTTNGLAFELIGSVTGAHAKGIAGSPDGTVFFGSSDGKIYTYKDGVFTSPTAFQNIGQDIHSLDAFENTLIVGTGILGRVFAINLENNDNLIIFDGPETDINTVHIKDALIADSPENANVFIGSSDTTTIYRANMDAFDFVKSFNSFNKVITRIRSVDNAAITDPAETAEEGTTTIAAIGTDLFKHVIPSWEFFFQHTEEIKDFVRYSTNGIEGIWVVSDNKVVKWTAELSTKTVFLRLRDKAGNVSRAPVFGGDDTCPNESTEICCDFAYSINISDLQNFVNESRIVDITEYGVIQFTFDSPNNRSFYSADKIDEETGIYTSEIFNGSNELVSWKTIDWDATEPTGTAVNVQIRSGATEDATSDAEWTPNLVKNSVDVVSIEHISDQYLQFRAILTSTVRSLSPSLTSVTVRNITAQASHFFTTNFVLPSRPIKGIMTANTFLPVSSDIVFGINTKNSVDFSDYQIIEPNRLFTSTQAQFDSNLRIGAKLLSPGIPQLTATNNPGDPYDESSFVCNVQFQFQNISGSSATYNFRVRFYNDTFRTQLIHTFFTGNDQTGWSVDGGSSSTFPSTGHTLANNATATVSFIPDTLVEQNQKWFITIDAHNGAFFETVLDNVSYICSACNIENIVGLISEYYATGLSSLTTIPDFSDFTPDFVGLEDDIDFAETDVAWVTSQGTDLGSSFVDDFAARWRGKVQAAATGTYTFILQSNDGSKLFIDAELVIDHDGAHAFTSKQGIVTLSEGFHDIEIQYFDGSGSAGIQLRWIPPSSSEQVIPASNLFHAVANEYCDDLDTPRLLNFAILFELEDGEFVKVNLD